MIRLIKDEFALEYTKRLHWSDVRPYYDTIKYDIELTCRYNSDGYSEETIEAMKKFLTYKLTDDDRLEILSSIKECCELEIGTDDTVFCRYVIVGGIYEWIENKFQFKW